MLNKIIIKLVICNRQGQKESVSKSLKLTEVILVKFRVVTKATGFLKRTENSLN